MKGAPDSDTARGTPGASRGWAHPLPPQQIPWRIPLSPCLPQEKTLGGFQQHFQGIEEWERQDPAIVPAQPAMALPTAPSCPLPMEGQDSKARAEMWQQGWLSSSQPAAPTAKFQSQPWTPGGRMRSCPWGRTQPLEHLTWKYLPKSPKRQQDPKHR